MQNKNVSLIILILAVIFYLPIFVNGQDKSERIGLDELIKTGTNYYNYSDKDKVNIEVIMWGYIKNPGKYLIPKGSTLIDLITLGGGPVPETKLDDIRLVRLKNDSINVKENKVF